MNNFNRIEQGDCLELMKFIPDNSIDLILCDPPYGTTKNRWDSVIPLDLMWEQFIRITVNRGAIVIFSQMPFTAILGASNIEMLKYEWIWVKRNSTGFLNCKFAPLKSHENILVFSKSVAGQVKDKERAMYYTPQMMPGKPYKTKREGKSISKNYCNSAKLTNTVCDGLRYPKDILEFNSEIGLHPTQKPVDLLRYLIRTYTDEGAVVLDPCMGSGSTVIAAIRENRAYIGFEKDERFFRISDERINKELNGTERLA